MDDPIKIIHKYKNNNRRVQYHIHIFIGDIVDDNCMRVLKKIKDLDLYNSLLIDERDREILVKNYGDFWYEKFFNTYHINATKDNTLKSAARMKELKSIYDSQWINTHFINYQKRLQTVTYSYEYAVKEERERKMVKKIIQKQQQDIEDMIDYTTSGKTNTQTTVTPQVEYEESRVIANEKPLITCDDDDSSEEEVEQYGGQENTADTESDIEFEDGANTDFDFENLEQEKEINAFENEVEQDLENVDIYGELDDTDKNIKLTTKEIKEVISNEVYDKINRKIAEFDTSKDNNMFDENLKDVYSKNYITHQYLFKDDTIKTIHNKICCAFKNDNKYGNNTYIIPSYQYLWSEYYYRDRIEKVMIGQKWIIKNDILKLDVEPNNNLGVYEDLRGNLRILRDNIRRLGKVKREDDDNNILFDYEGFFTCNELYMIDIYNELGLNYDPNFDELRNLIDVYLRIYFPKIRPDDIQSIIDFLNTRAPEQKKIMERNKLKNIFDTINNDLILENEIMRDIEYVGKKNYKEYRKIFQENYVTQSVIRAYLMDRYDKLNLYHIFDNFNLDENYPFIQYQPADGTPKYRYSEKYLMDNANKEIIMKWFENSPYGISFKVRVTDDKDPNNTYKYMAINLSDNGRIDYKIQWKEEDMSTVEDINETYKYIRELIEKINRENDRYHIRLNIPNDNDFKFAFINTIQKFELPDNYTINHNDLSEFSRYFFPYVALVIEPRKRQSKVKRGDNDQKSKFGTYLRYKRVSKYENRTKIEHRIIFFMRNYEYNDQSLADEISKEFNITEEQAITEIQNVRDKFPNIKKSRKVLKKLENIPKYKPPGIGVDIQGKTRTKYKMRIAGARSREQLDRIIRFMNILIYLYLETYLYKKPERQKMKENLKKLTKIARRRNKVEEIVNHESTVKTVKQMTSFDHRRLSYKAEEDQNQWTRNCQNSGDDKLRRPQQFQNIEELQKLGYVWRDKLDEYDFGHYERKVMVDDDGNTNSKKKKKEVVLRAVKLPLDNTGENFVYYTCSPEENGKHMYIGFLSKSKNPFGEAMPCCFIKDHLYSKNKDKRNFYLKSIGLLPDDEEVNKISGDQLYILQDSNKIQEGRFAFLPKYLDIFMNFMLGHDRKIKNHYLLSTPTGYYFKYGTKQDEYKYLNAITAIFDLTIDEIKAKLIQTLENDKNQTIFTSLNNGDVRTQFGDIATYISYIKNNEYLEYPFLNDLLSIPGVITENGVNIVIFQKKLKIIRKVLEKEKIKESYYVVCQNPENVGDLKDPDRDTVFIIKESKNYYPIIMVKKENENTKDVDIIKMFKYSNDNNNIVNHIFKYYKINCKSEFSVLVNDKSSAGYNAKNTYAILAKIARREYLPKYQIVDARYKCKYLITYGGYIVPTLPSGSIYNLNITSNLDNYVKDYDTTYKYLTDIAQASKNELKLEPMGLYFREKRKNNYIISAIMTQSYDAVPIIEKVMTTDYIKKEKLLLQSKPNDDTIDKDIQKGPANIVVDNRVYNVAKNKYDTELYQLFRYHLSYYLNNVPAGLKFKDKLENIINNNKINKRERKLEIKRLLYQMTNADLARTYNELLKKKDLLMEKKKKKARQDNENLDNAASQEKYIQDDLTNLTDPDLAVTALNEANTPIQAPDNVLPQIVSDRPIDVKSAQIIPRDFNTRDRRPRSNLRELAENTAPEFDFRDDTVPPVSTYDFIKNDPPVMDFINFPPDEKTWIHVAPNNKKIDYPAYVLKNHRELCYSNDTREKCANSQHCNWINSKNMCMLTVKQDMLVDYINQVAEEFIQNELKAQEILRKGDYFVSDIVNYNVFTERPGERIIMVSNTNLNKILSEIFGKDNIPKIGKRRNKPGEMQDYEQLNIDNPIVDANNWYLQNIIENNNTYYRAFANVYFWLMHPYNDINYRNLGYYSGLQTNLSNIYKSQIIDWLSDPVNITEIDGLAKYMYTNKLTDYIAKLGNDVRTLTPGIVEFYILSKIYESIIYINDDNFNIIYAIHPSQGVIFDHTENYDFDISKYTNFAKVVNLRYQYSSRNIFPDRVEAMYPKI